MNMYRYNRTTSIICLSGKWSIKIVAFLVFVFYGVNLAPTNYFIKFTERLILALFYLLKHTHSFWESIKSPTPDFIDYAIKRIKLYIFEICFS